MLAFEKGKKYKLKTVDEMLAMDGVTSRNSSDIIEYERDPRNVFYTPGMANYFQESYEATRDCTVFSEGPYKWYPWMFEELDKTPTKKLLSHIRGLQ